MTENYLQVMVESLEKKNEVLDSIIELDDRQAKLSINPNMDMIEYDQTMEEKGKLIDELNRLDDGFTSTYELVREEVTNDPKKYRDTVLRMQELIRTAVEKTTTIEAKEARNKMALEGFFKNKRSEIRHQRVSNKAASRYYKEMSRINDVDPQLMDRKK